MCTNFEINQNKIDESKKYAKIVCHGGWILLIDIFIRNILQPTRSLYDFRLKNMARKVVLMFLMTVTLTFDLCYIGCHAK